MVVVTRPANPTGWTLPLEDLAAERMTLVDESFLDFSGQTSASTLLPNHPQLMILRSLTKFYALPGLRVGAIIANAETIHAWKRQREPWQVNVLAEEAALAAIADLAHAEKSRAFVMDERRWLFQQLQTVPLAEPLASDANFLYVRLGYSASALCDYFLQRKILVRNCNAWPGLPAEAVRIAVRSHAENQRLISAWKAYPCH
jgi:threonine-phosphate decarboxylase